MCVTHKLTIYDIENVTYLSIYSRLLIIIVYFKRISRAGYYLQMQAIFPAYLRFESLTKK